MLSLSLCSFTHCGHQSTSFSSCSCSWTLHSPPSSEWAPKGATVRARKWATSTSQGSSARGDFTEHGLLGLVVQPLLEGTFVILEGLDVSLKNLNGLVEFPVFKISHEVNTITGNEVSININTLHYITRMLVLLAQCMHGLM